MYSIVSEMGDSWLPGPTPEAALANSGIWPLGKTVRIVGENGAVVPLSSTIEALTWAWLGNNVLTDRLSQEQVEWAKALSRPRHDVKAVAVSLKRALGERDLDRWELKQLPNAQSVWAEAKLKERRCPQGHLRHEVCWHAGVVNPFTFWRNQRAAESGRKLWGHRASECFFPPVPRGTTLSRSQAEAAGQAEFAQQRIMDIARWVTSEAAIALGLYLGVAENSVNDVQSDLLAVGLRDAYTNGLAVAAPLPGGRVLAWAMI